MCHEQATTLKHIQTNVQCAVFEHHQRAGLPLFAGNLDLDIDMPTLCVYTANDTDLRLANEKHLNRITSSGIKVVANSFKRVTSINMGYPNHEDYISCNKTTTLNDTQEPAMYETSLITCAVCKK